MPDLPDLFATVTTAVADVVDTEPEPDTETPCPDWTYGQLLGHLVGGDRMCLKILAGAARPPTAARLAPDADRPPPSPADYRMWSSRLGAVFEDVEVRSGEFQLPVGLLNGEQVILLRSVEHLLHGWDLAKAAGATARGLDPVAAALEEPARHLLAAVGDATVGDRRPFASPVIVDDSVPVADRVAAAFGRDPGWAPDPVAGYDRLTEQFTGREDVEMPDGSRRGFGADGLRIRNQVFACSYRDRLMIKVPAPEVDRLIADGLGAPLAKPGQRPMREWVLVPFDGSAPRRAELAYEFVRGAE